MVRLFVAFLGVISLSFGESLGIVKGKIEKILSKWSVKVLAVRDLGSLYEVDVLGAPRILYFTKDLRYMIMGGVFDPSTGKNLTYERLKELGGKNGTSTSNINNK
jgi:hypothetical protein